MKQGKLVDMHVLLKRESRDRGGRRDDAWEESGEKLNRAVGSAEGANTPTS